MILLVLEQLFCLGALLRLLSGAGELTTLVRGHSALGSGACTLRPVIAESSCGMGNKRTANPGGQKNAGKTLAVWVWLHAQRVHASMQRVLRDGEAALSCRPSQSTLGSGFLKPLRPPSP